jgi:hypothetical protein
VGEGGDTKDIISKDATSQVDKIDTLEDIVDVKNFGRVWNSFVRRHPGVLVGDMKDFVPTSESKAFEAMVIEEGEPKEGGLSDEEYGTDED